MKSKILLLTAMLASASFASAQTIEYGGVTFELLKGDENVKVTYKGYVGERIEEETANHYGNWIEVRKASTQTITGQKRQVNVKAIAVDKQAVAGSKMHQILKWSNPSQSPKEVELSTSKIGINDFGTIAFDNAPEYTHIINWDDPDYETYYTLCDKAIELGVNLKPGYQITAAAKDDSGVDICEDLYYFEKVNVVTEKDEQGNIIYIRPGRPQQTTTYVYTCITEVKGSISEKITWDQCTDELTPTEISDDLEWNVTTSGKVGVVTGIVNQARIEEAIARGERNFDFTGALVLGGVNMDVPANKLAYFPQYRDDEEELNFNATGTNIVKGGQCAKYLIKDNGKEIYVNKGFTAGEATYERDFKAGTYGTIVLPFMAVNTNETFERLARLNGYDAVANKISCITDVSIGANTPYLVQINSNADGIYETDAKVVPTGNPKSGVYSGLQLAGSYTPIDGSALTNNYIFSTTGVIGRLNVKSTLKPGRCYFNYTPASSSSAKITNATIEIMDEEGSIVDFIAPNFDEEATDIDGVVENSKVVSVQYISVNGQISNAPVKGMNLVKKTYADGTVETSKIAY